MPYVTRFNRRLSALNITLLADLEIVSAISLAAYKFKIIAIGI